MITKAITLKTHSPAHRLRASQSGIHLALILASVTMLLPFVFMVLGSFKTYGEAIAMPPILFPKAMWQKVLSGEKDWTYLFNNYAFLFGKMNFIAFLFRNTLLLIAGRIFCAVAFSSLAAYAFAKLQFPFKKQIFSLVLIQLMLPDQVFLVPQFRMVAAMGWVNTIPGLIFPGLVSAFGTLIRSEQTDYKKVKCNLYYSHTRVKILRLFGCKKNTHRRARRSRSTIYTS
jgi:ABC-type glycerol-3-phosphate transport system permease component